MAALREVLGTVPDETDRRGDGVCYKSVAKPEPGSRVFVVLAALPLAWYIFDIRFLGANMVHRLPQVPPDRYLTFLEVPPFPTRWDSFRLPESDLIALQAILMADPQAGDVVPGSGGYRKLRFSPPSWQTGKRGALRVYYLHYPRHGVVLLNAIYAKNERADLSATQKKSLARLAAVFDGLLQQAAETRLPK